MTNGWLIGSYILLWLVAALNSVILLATLRHVSNLYYQVHNRSKVEGPVILGKPLPAAALIDAAGTPSTFELSGARTSLLLIVGAACESCHQLMSAVANDLNTAATNGWTIAVIERSGDGMSLKRLRDRYALVDHIMTFRDEGDVETVWEVGTIPYAIVLTAGRVSRIARPPDAKWLKTLLADGSVPAVPALAGTATAAVSQHA